MTRLLLVDTSQYAPVSPIFRNSLYALEDENILKSYFVDEHNVWPFHQNLNAKIPEAIHRWNPHIVLIVKADRITQDTLQIIRRSGAQLVRWNFDDPWNAAVNSGPQETIPLYDLYVTCKQAIIPDLKNAGAQRVAWIPCGYHPHLHFPSPPSPERTSYACDVAIIGGADASRVDTVRQLRDALPDLTIALYGAYWEMEPDLRPLAHGIVHGEDFRQAIAHSKLCLNLLRETNRDDHNMRTFEIPACGGVQVAPYTDEHAEWFQHRESILFYRDFDYLVKLIRDTLHDAPLRFRVAMGGRRTVESHTWTARLREMLALLTPLV